MAVQRTFSILKPDVTRRNLTGAVNQRIEAAGLRIVAQKRVQMTRLADERVNRTLWVERGPCVSLD